MDAILCSPFETLEICFRLLSTGPACLTVDGRRLGNGLPARRIALVELQILLQQPMTIDLQRAVVSELVRLAAEERGQWIIALAGLLLPRLRPIAAAEALRERRPVAEVEVALLEILRDAIGQPRSVAVQFVEEVLRIGTALQRSLRPAER
jgi:hypothetical protein